MLARTDYSLTGSRLRRASRIRVIWRAIFGRSSAQPRGSFAGHCVDLRHSGTCRRRRLSSTNDLSCTVLGSSCPRRSKGQDPPQPSKSLQDRRRRPRHDLCRNDDDWSVVIRLSDVEDMRYVRMALLSAAATGLAIRDARDRRDRAPFRVRKVWSDQRRDAASARRSCFRTRAGDRGRAWSDGVCTRDRSRNPTARQPVPCGSLGRDHVSL